MQKEQFISRGVRIHNCLQPGRIGLKRIYTEKSPGGFTLLELLLATLISALIMGILSVSFSFCLRLWERHQNRGRDDMPQLLEFMTMQIGELNLTPVSHDEKEEPVLIGNRDSLAFETNHSLKALSSGVPVIARYVFIPEEKTLYYAEIPLVPKDAEMVEGFLAMDPMDTGQWPMFHPVAVEDISFAYMHREGVEEETGSRNRNVELKDEWEGEPEDFGGVLIDVVSAVGSTRTSRFIPVGFLDFNTLDASSMGGYTTGSGQMNTPGPVQQGSPGARSNATNE